MLTFEHWKETMYNGLGDISFCNLSSETGHLILGNKTTEFMPARLACHGAERCKT